MNSTPRLCVELNGCVANNLGFLGEPSFGMLGTQTPPTIGALEALAWLNGPFAFDGEVHITIRSRDCEFHERAMHWLDTHHFTLRTGIQENQVHPIGPSDNMQAFTLGLEATIAVGSTVDDLKQFLLADHQLLFDPHGSELESYQALRDGARGRIMSIVKSWREIMEYCP